MDARKYQMLIAAIDEAIGHEVDAQREYKNKAKIYNLPVFNTLAALEKKHEKTLRELRNKVLEEIDKREDDSLTNLF